MDFIVYYLGIGTIIANILAIRTNLHIAKHNIEGVLDIGGLVKIIPLWPYALYELISSSLKTGDDIEG